MSQAPTMTSPRKNASGWTELRLRYCATINPPKSETSHLPGDTPVSFVPMEALGELGGLRLDQTKTLDEVSGGYTYFRDGDVIVAKITPCFENGKGAIAEGLENGVAFGTTELHVLRPGPSLDRRFLFYLTLSHIFRSRGTGCMYGAGGQKRVPDDFIRNFRHPIPPLSDQRAIAAFLDRETARIDALIEKKRRQIELLQEKRSALISHAVTKGLDPNVKMKDSGMDWLGSIPQHWQVKRLKFITPHVTVGIVVTPSKFYVDEGVPCLRSLNVREGRLVDTDLVFISPESNDLHAKSKIRAGDVVAVRSGQPGTTAVVDERFDGANCIDLIIIRLSTHFDSTYLSYAMASQYVQSQFGAGSGGAIQQHFNIETASNLLIALPPRPEQEAIRDFLNAEAGRLAVLRDKVQASITKLHEYRASLISAAVTGKLDVREEVA